jgi:glucose-1-phosphate adenylyltransferase
MDYEQMLVQHVETHADITIGCLEVPRMEATAFGVMHVDEQSRIKAFVEKPADPPAMPGRPDIALASMGLYIFNTDYLIELLRQDAAHPKSGHDFGHDLVPYIVEHGKAVAHRFSQSCVRGEDEDEPYWRDVGTIDAYWEANIDLTAEQPALNLYDNNWPIWTYSELAPPAKFVHDEVTRRGEAIDSLVSGGCIISGTRIRRSVLFTSVHTHSYASVEDSVILPRVQIGRNARLRKVVVDRSVEIPEGLVVGEDAELDAKRFRRTSKGICLITQPMIDRLR